MKRLAIIGGGSWGTALSIVLAPRFDRIRLWFHEDDLAERAATTRVNDLYLPGFQLPRRWSRPSNLEQALEGAEVVLGVMPSHHARSLYGRMLPHLEPSMRFVSATKGIENGTLMRVSEVIAEVVGRAVSAASGGTVRPDVRPRNRARGTGGHRDFVGR